MKMSQKEYEDYVKKIQHLEEKREIEHRLQEDFKVFVSYSHADEEFAQKITDLFDSIGIKNYVIDKKELEWGGDIREFAKQNISQCTHYLLILSEASANSKWCALEFGIALGAKKEVLLYLTTDEIQVPDYAANVLATSNIDVVSGYFGNDLIRPEAIEKFLEEIIDDRQAKLNEFKCVGTHESGNICWDAPNRREILEAKPDPMRAYLDDHIDQSAERLYRIEFTGSDNDKALILCYKREGYKPARYVLSYKDELTAVMVEPEKRSSYSIGIRQSMENGSVELIHKAPSVEEQLYNKVVHGWEASRSFWDKPSSP